jgi:DNA-binding NarL/FixJ family response regulator
VHGLDLELRTKGGELIDCLVSADTVAIKGQKCVLCAIQDITDRKRSEDELKAAIEAVMTDSWFGRTVVEKLAALRRTSRPSKPSAHLDELTARERDILGLICQGQSDVDMSVTLRLSRNTVRNHIASLYRKIGSTGAPRRSFGPESAGSTEETQSSPTDANAAMTGPGASS